MNTCSCNIMGVFIGDDAFNKANMVQSFCTHCSLFYFRTACFMQPLRKTILINFVFLFQKLFDKYDRNSDGHIEFVDFVQYVLDHEKKLRLSFHDLDHNQDGEFTLTQQSSHNFLIITKTVRPAFIPRITSLRILCDFVLL